MKPLFLLCLGLSLSSASSGPTLAQNSRESQSFNDVVIAAIRHEIRFIERNAPKYRRVAIRCDGKSAEGGELTGFFQDQSLRKAVRDVFGEMGRSITAMYFQSNRLIFAVSTTIHYKRPFCFDEKKKGLEIKSEVQERGWFSQRRLIAASGDDGKMILIPSAKAKSLDARFSEAASEATTALSEAKPRRWGYDDSSKHPVDAKVDALLAHPKCTSDETIGARMAAQLWDDELNRVYRELRSKLDASDANALQDAQRRWIAWRDAEFGFTGSIYFRQPGSMFQPMSEHHKMNIVRSRVFNLQHWLEMQENYLEHQREMGALEQTLHP